MVRDNHRWWFMKRKPVLFNCIKHRLGFLVGDDFAHCPPNATINEMNQDILFPKQEICFNLLIESIANSGAVGGSVLWSDPISATFACIDHFPVLTDQGRRSPACRKQRSQLFNCRMPIFAMQCSKNTFSGFWIKLLRQQFSALSLCHSLPNLDLLTLE